MQYFDHHERQEAGRVTRADIEAAYNNRPGAAVDDIGGEEEYGAVSVVEGDIAEFRKDEAAEEAEAEGR
jgi:hypothetical protein